jgi:hemerythrin-like domain-containing protein
MKVIGMANDGWKHEKVYICEVRHAELEKFMGLFYDKMDALKVGDSVELGKGYDYAAEISNAMKTTKEFIESNKKIVEAILNGLTITAKHNAVTSDCDNECDNCNISETCSHKYPHLNVGENK